MQRIISRTPLRISFFGGGTDYPAYYLRHPGAVLGTTINQYVYVNLNTLSRFVDHRLRISYSKIEMVNCIEEIQHPSIRACLFHKNLFPPLDVHISADLPAKTGLGSSSSFTVGFLNALYAMQGQKVSKQRLAEEACFIEQKVIAEHVGSQDQFHASFGGMNIVEFSDSHIKARPLILSKERKQQFREHLLAFYTGITRYASEIVKEQIEKTEKKNNDAYLQRMYDMVFEAEAIFSSAPQSDMIPLLGKLLDESWQCKRRLSTQVSTPLIDEWYQKAKDWGAYGGKLCGAGSGGFLLLLAPIEAHASIRNVLGSLSEVSFEFENEGSQIIYMRE